MGESTDMTEDVTRSPRKRRAILEAATALFLRNGYLGTNMDEVATLARVSKQTVYKHFANKESLFIDIVKAMTNAGSDAVHGGVPPFVDGTDVAEFLLAYACRQLDIVLTPQLLQLRRMVIGEVSRFPELGRSLYEAGPRRAMAAFSETLSDLAFRGLLCIDDAKTAASDFNWLIMAAPLNAAMLLGDEAVPSRQRLRKHAERSVRLFLAIYQKR